MLIVRKILLAMMIVFVATVGHAQFTPVQPRASAAAGEAEGGELILYDGSLDKSRFGMRVASWGGGQATEVTDVKFKGSGAIKVEIRGPYEGGRIDLTNGPALPKSNEGAYLVFYTLLKEQQQVAPSAMVVPMEGVAPVGQMGAEVIPGPVATPTPMPGGPQTGEGIQPKKEKKELEHLRVVLFFDKGMGVVEQYPIIVYDTTTDGWSKIGIPFAAFRCSPDAGGNLRRLVICGDAAQTIHIGRVSIVRDTAPIQAEIRRPSTRDEPHNTEIKLGEEVDLKVYAEAGMAALEVTWDFDDRDGISVEAEGLEVTHRYEKRGSYTVTATVSDVAKQKQPVQVQYVVNVK